ncbi:MAG: urea carboxylase-associated family protein [Chloroflexi bacterium]|nr:urea carboxylase-associated family protein [Chloroflexota bacterium]
MAELSNKRLEYDVPARMGKAFRVSKGELIKVIDVKGGQAADFFAFNVDNIKEYLSAEHTRPSISRLFPLEGEGFYTQERRPIMTLVVDHTPGIHDMLFAACNPSRYRELGVEGWHASCEENLGKEMEAIGIPGVEIPQPVNLFTSFPLSSDGAIGIAAPETRPGDYVVMRAEMDSYVCVSACPQDQNQTNSGVPTEIRVEVGS